jgi:hypothetical protein
VGLERDGVKVLDVKTEEKDGKLYVTIKAEVDGAAGEYKITFYRERSGITSYVLREGWGGCCESYQAVEVLTGERPIAVEMSDGRTRIKGSGRHRRLGAVRRAERGDREVEQPINIPTSRVACRMNSTAGKGPRQRGST